MSRFRIQLLLEDNTWSTKFHTGRNSNYSSSSTDWSLLNLDLYLLEQNEKYLDFFKNQEESITEKNINKKMDHFFDVMFEDVRRERSLIYYYH